jgi:hypothetical protein
MFLFLWVMFVLMAIGFFLWSTHTLFEQKRGWKVYAKKLNLNYVAGPMMQSPSMAGEIKGYRVNFYPQITENAQGQRSTQNVIEVFLNDIPDTLCVVTSPGFSDFVAALDLPEPFSVDDSHWPKNALARSFEDEMPQAWFMGSKDRLNAIELLIKLPFDTAFVADGKQAFIAVRTPNPISDPKKINQVVNKIIQIVILLESENQEAKVEEGRDSYVE